MIASACRLGISKGIACIDAQKIRVKERAFIAAGSVGAKTSTTLQCASSRADAR
jgi:hypothetical protein